MANHGHDFRQQLRDQAQQADVYAPECPSRRLLDHVTSRWGVLALVLLLDGPARFSELANSIGGVSDKMLSQTLKLLVGDGFVNRVVSPEPPVRVSYELTTAGHQAAIRLAELVELLESQINTMAAAATAN